MDQGPLVEPQIDDGFKLIKKLAAAGCDVAAAFWVKEHEYGDGRWALLSGVEELRREGVAGRLPETD